MGLRITPSVKFFSSILMLSLSKVSLVAGMVVSASPCFLMTNTFSVEL